MALTPAVFVNERPNARSNLVGPHLNLDMNIWISIGHRVLLGSTGHVVSDVTDTISLLYICKKGHGYNDICTTMTHRGVHTKYQAIFIAFSGQITTFFHFEFFSRVNLTACNNNISIFLRTTTRETNIFFFKCSN